MTTFNLVKETTGTEKILKRFTGSSCSGLNQIFTMPDTGGQFATSGYVGCFVGDITGDAPKEYIELGRRSHPMTIFKRADQGKRFTIQQIKEVIKDLKEVKRELLVLVGKRNNNVYRLYTGERIAKVMNKPDSVGCSNIIAEFMWWHNVKIDLTLLMTCLKSVVDLAKLQGQTTVNVSVIAEFAPVIFTVGNAKILIMPCAW